MIPFNNKIKNRAKKINSYLCVGIDVDPVLVKSNKFDDLVSHSKRIVDAILSLNKVQKVKVEVEKIQPPIDATFDKISVTAKGEN